MNLHSLADACRLGATRAGGKAARLGVVQRLGLRVLPGAVVLAEDLERLLTGSEWFERNLEAPPAGGAAARRIERQRYEDARRSVGWRADPRAIVQRLLETLAYPHGALIVRSSARDEDGVHSSWAGLFESVFCRARAEDLSEALRSVWASQWSYAVALYARRRGRLGARPSMSILVQPAARPSASGVVFSRSPLDPRVEHRLVEATWGLPKAVVEGSAPVDRFYIATGGRVASATIAEKSRALDVVEGALVTRPVAIERQRTPCLTARQIEELERCVSQLEERFNGPQDVEWGWVDDNLTIFQVRPQTGLSDSTQRVGNGGAVNREGV